MYYSETFDVHSLRDILNNGKSFFFCECASNIGHYYKKFKGFIIPNIYISSLYSYLNKDLSIVSLSNDREHYTKLLKYIGYVWVFITRII